MYVCWKALLKLRVQLSLNVTKFIAKNMNMTCIPNHGCDCVAHVSQFTG